MDETPLPASGPGDEQRPQPSTAPVRPEATTASVAARLADDYAHPPPRRRVALPVALFLLTCLSTFLVGAVGWRPDVLFGNASTVAGKLIAGWPQGLVYMAAVMGILLTHEMGHFLVTLKYKIPASLPFFLPVPIIPFGTLGAVIAMQNSRADRRQLFDLGIAGPLAGLFVALPVLYFGILQLDPAGAAMPESRLALKDPLLIRWMIETLRPDCARLDSVSFAQSNPLLMAGWVGMLVTGLNMVPVSQLDGGHVAYGLFGRRAHVLARTLVVAAIIAILVFEAYIWVAMFVLVIFLGIHHPATANDYVPLGWPRRLLGYASLAIPILCFPPMT